MNAAREHSRGAGPYRIAVKAINKGKGGSELSVGRRRGRFAWRRARTARPFISRPFRLGAWRKRGLDGDARRASRALATSTTMSTLPRASQGFRRASATWSGWAGTPTMSPARRGSAETETRGSRTWSTKPASSWPPWGSPRRTDRTPRPVPSSAGP